MCGWRNQGWLSVAKRSFRVGWANCINISTKNHVLWHFLLSFKVFLGSSLPYPLPLSYSMCFDDSMQSRTRTLSLDCSLTLIQRCILKNSSHNPSFTNKVCCFNGYGYLASLVNPLSRSTVKKSTVTRLFTLFSFCRWKQYYRQRCNKPKITYKV